MRLALVAIALVACSGTQVQQQARAADVVARAFSTVVRPTLVAAYETACRADIETACPAPPCERAALQATLAFCDARWQPAMLAYEAARLAHGTWRATLLRCQGTPDGGTCAVDLARDGAAFLQRALAYRCVVRALGHAELDPIPGTPVCTVTDGGS